jgi:hypothetical protein
MARLRKFGTLTVASAFLLLGTAFAQRPNDNRPPQRQQPQAHASSANAARPPAQNQNANRPPANANPNASHPPARPQNSPTSHYSGNPNRPPATTISPGQPNRFDNGRRSDRPNYNSSNNGARLNPRQQIGAGSPPPLIDRMRDMTPQQRERQLQSSRVFQNLAPDKQSRIRNQFNQWDRMSPQQRADLREKENTWRNLSPEQKQHIKNDVLPQWRQTPWTRQQVIQQKLGQLQNMPESARNRRLADPNFTRGLSDEDRNMLHDLAHMHVGGAPDPPSNEP